MQTHDRAAVGPVILPLKGSDRFRMFGHVHPGNLILMVLTFCGINFHRQRHPVLAPAQSRY